MARQNMGASDETADGKSRVSPAAKRVAAANEPSAAAQALAAHEDRGITIGEDAIGNAIISGNGNVVIVQTARQIAKPTPAATQSNVGPNPYKGLLAFQEEDADRFFGREAQIGRLWELFRDLHESVGRDEPAVRLLPILGPSGSGKSSLARAGLVPELARRPLPGRDNARVAVIKPGAHPLEALASVLAKIATADPAPVAKTRELASELKRPNDEGQYDGLRRIADVLPNIASSPLVVLVDQFEEVYSLCQDSDEVDAFVGNLLNAAVDRSAYVSAIITLRTDYLDQTQHHAVLNTAISRLGAIIPALTEEELRRAITKPARLAGRPLDDAVVDLLIHETEGREGALPLLQFALTRIWDGLGEGVEPTETLKRIGGVGGALAREAQRIYEELTDRGKKITRRVFLGLVQLGEGTPDMRRRAVLTSLVAYGDDPSDVQAVIDRFSSAGARLITVSAEPDGTETAEVTHEALFEHWQMLDEWLASGRDDLRFQRRLDQAARHWARHDRADGLVWRPPDLDLLAQYQTRHVEDMTPLQLDFMLASKKAERDRIAEIDRRKREKVRLLWTIVGVSTVSAVIAIGLSIFAFAEGRRADRSAKHSHQAANDILEALASEGFSTVPEMANTTSDLLNKSLALFQSAETSTDPETVLKTAITYRSAAHVFRNRGNFEEANQYYDNSIDELTQLAKEFPDQPRYKRELATSYNWRGWLRIKHLGDYDGAAEDYEQALNRQDKLIADYSKHPDYQWEHARTTNNRGILQKSRSEKAKESAAAEQLQELAEKDYRDAIDRLEKLAAEHTESASINIYRQELARCYNNLGNLLKVRNGLPEEDREPKTTETYLKAIRLNRLLLEQDPQNREFRLELAQHLNNLANLKRTSAPSEAAGYNEEAITLLGGLVIGNPFLASEYSNAFNSRANILAGVLKQKDENEQAHLRLQVAQALDEAVGVAQLLLDNYPHDTEYQKRFRQPLYALGRHYLVLKDHESAANAVRRLRADFTYSAETYESAAMIMAHCIPLVFDNKAPPDEQPRKELIVNYGDEALRLIKLAIRHGYGLDELRQRKAHYAALGRAYKTVKGLDFDPFEQLLKEGNDSEPPTK